MEQWITEIIDPYYLRILILMGINIIMVLGLNITTGVTGQLSMGHAGFMSLGAYTSAILTLELGIPSADAAGRCGCGGGFRIYYRTAGSAPEGDYLAMVTIGFAEIVRVFFLNFEPGGKAVGLSGIPQQTTFSLVPLLTIVVIFFTQRLLSSRIGKAMYSIRENEIAAEACGINTTPFEGLVLCFGGLFWADWAEPCMPTTYYINPQDFDFMRSIEMLNMVVLGGLGSIRGLLWSGHSYRDCRRCCA